jgi:hypothetical protein
MRRSMLALIIAAAPAAHAGDGTSVDEKYDDGKYEYRYLDAHGNGPAFTHENGPTYWISLDAARLSV